MDACSHLRGLRTHPAWRSHLFYAKGEKHRVCAENTTRDRMDFAESDYLDQAHFSGAKLVAIYFAGEEAIRTATGERFHKQQSPVALLLRILLASTVPDDWVLDPFAGTGTTTVVAEQLGRYCLCIEIDPGNVEMIRQRLVSRRPADAVLPLRSYYRFTPDLDTIWPVKASGLRQPGGQLAFLDRGL